LIWRGKIKSKSNLNIDEKYSGNKISGFFALNILIILISIFLVYSIIIKISPPKEENIIVKESLDRIPTVEVLNGCGYPGIAEKFTDLLRSKNFDVVKIGNFSSFDIDTTFVIDRLGEKKYALAVAESMKIPAENVIQHFNKNYFLDVTFVIGKDFNNYLKGE